MADRGRQRGRSPVRDSTLAAGAAVRISAGAVLPGGADMMLVREDCRTSGALSRFSGSPPRPPGRHIHQPDLDFNTGHMVARAGGHITPARLAFAVSADLDRLQVGCAPQVAAIDSGTELRAQAAPDDLRPGDIPANNGLMLAGYPCAAQRIAPVSDDKAVLQAASPA
ncbi:hypothetical protein RM533_04750 [Croceicoccus sp. F390]|uniref:Molybdopterin molybdenumtransferase n=1 Tax=Croceicoccus esteveae TaxID=3075597 RepID=A0ABU2ZFW3_9SPHN|nr:hypothetical protein [Croceicoccus sp. F390]MDT0575486.1 hypothetical protein [Croceicoccus sp. F390]